MKDLQQRAGVGRTSSINISCHHLADYVKKKTRNKKRAARAARFISLIQPIKSLTFGVVVAVIS